MSAPMDNAAAAAAFDRSVAEQELMDALRRRCKRGEPITHEERATLLRAVVQTSRSEKNLQHAVSYAKSLSLASVAVRPCDLAALLYEVHEFRALVPAKPADEVAS